MLAISGLLAIIAVSDSADVDPRYSPFFLPQFPPMYRFNATLTHRMVQEPGAAGGPLRTRITKMMYAFALGPMMRQVLVENGVYQNTAQYDVCKDGAGRRYRYTWNDDQPGTCSESAVSDCTPTFDSRWDYFNFSSLSARPCRGPLGEGLRYELVGNPMGASTCVQWVREPPGYRPREGDHATAMRDVAEMTMGVDAGEMLQRAQTNAAPPAPKRHHVFDENGYVFEGAYGHRDGDRVRGLGGYEGAPTAAEWLESPAVYPRLIRFEEATASQMKDWSVDEFQIEFDEGVFEVPKVCFGAMDGA